MAYKEADELTVAEMAGYAKCHRSTVLRFEQRGLIRSKRNYANHRLYTWVEANKLKEMLDHRYSDISDS
jgi:DNA-binding transcriptional MerR regulator